MWDDVRMPCRKSYDVECVTRYLDVKFVRVMQRRPIKEARKYRIHRVVEQGVKLYYQTNY
jgi:hypothetical protein